MAEEKKMTYEQAMGRISEILEELEKGDVPLEDSIRLVEEGLGLVSRCERQLKEFDEKLEKVIAGYEEKEGEGEDA